jgi:hypothetical protein
MESRSNLTASPEATGLPPPWQSHCQHTGTWRFTDDVRRDDIILCVPNDAIHRACRDLEAAVIPSIGMYAINWESMNGWLMPTIFAWGLFKAAPKTNRDPTEAINSNVAHHDFLPVFCRPDTGTSVVQ